MTNVSSARREDFPAVAITQNEVTNLVAGATAHGRGEVVVLSKEAAVLPCGCRFYVGLRIDNHEQATVAAPCEHGHNALMARANDLLRESLQHPSGRETVDVLVALLDQAQQESDDG